MQSAADFMNMFFYEWHHSGRGCGWAGLPLIDVKCAGRDLVWGGGSHCAPAQSWEPLLSLPLSE